MNYSAKLRLYFHICKRFRGKVLDFWGLIGKNLRRWGGASCPTDFTDTHGFFCVVLMFQVTQISQISQNFFGYSLLGYSENRRSLGNLRDFLGKYLLFHR